MGRATLRACGGVCDTYSVEVHVFPLDADTFGESDEPDEPGPCPQPFVDSGARFTSISREVEVFPDCDPDDARFATTSTIIHDDDHVVTGEDSIAVISFADLSTLVLRGDYEIVVRRRMEIDAPEATLWMNLKKVIRGEPVEVKSNMGFLAIKGTTFSYEVTDAAEKLKVIEGSVDFRSLVTGEETVVSSGQTASATSNGLTEVQAFDGAAEQAQWDLLLAEHGVEVQGAMQDGIGDDSTAAERRGSGTAHEDDLVGASARSSWSDWRINRDESPVLLVIGLLVCVLSISLSLFAVVLLRRQGTPATVDVASGRTAPMSLPETAAERAGARFCTDCGARVPAGSRFCGSCGARQD
jgi:hypothetical protein